MYLLAGQLFGPDLRQHLSIIAGGMQSAANVAIVRPDKHAVGDPALHERCELAVALACGRPCRLQQEAFIKHLRYTLDSQ